MPATLIGDVTNQVQKYWAPKFTKQLRAQMLLPSLVSKDYEGQIKRGGDTVYVSQINAPSNSIRTVGTDADVYSAKKVSMTRIAIVASKRATSAYEFEDLAILQSQLDQQDSEMKDSLMFDLNNQINTYLFSLVSPSTSAPDHLIGGTSAFAKANLQAARKLAGAAKWGKNKRWFGLMDPTYYTDCLGDSVLGSSDYGAGDAPVIGGQIGLPRFGFDLYEDNSDGLLTADTGATATEKVALLAHPDFMHMVSQTEVQVKISDLHPTGKFGYAMSVDLVFGAALGIDGNKKHIVFRATA